VVNEVVLETDVVVVTVVVTFVVLVNDVNEVDLVGENKHQPSQSFCVCDL
jgi:hypothetical protein